MKVELAPGKYIVAVSGGVDSVVLLHLLANFQLPANSYQLIVAHFDHGIRADSASDRKFVGGLAIKYNLPFEFAEGKLGASASEATARKVRYEFLEKTRIASGASAIVTAHHQDDLIETALINLLRGTNRRGLASLKSTDKIKRPLLAYSKQTIKNYAEKNQLAWREDPTNADTKYLRNYVRHKLVPKLGASGRAELLAIIASASTQNSKIDELLASLLAGASGRLDRRWFIGLSDSVALEIMAAWLRANGITNYDKKTLARLALAAKSARNGVSIEIKNTSKMKVGRDFLALELAER